MQLLIRSMIAIVLALAAALPGAAHHGHGSAPVAAEAIAAEHHHACEAETQSVCEADPAASDCTLSVGHCAGALAAAAGHDAAELQFSRLTVRPRHGRRVTGLMHGAEPPPPRI